MPKIRLVFSDLDGVLLSNNHVPNAAIEKINKLISKDILFCITSGRRLESAERTVLNKLRCYFILENGSILGDNFDEKIKRYGEWHSKIKDELPELKQLRELFSKNYDIIEKEFMFTITSNQDIQIPGEFKKVTVKRNKEDLDFFPISAGKKNAAKFLLKKIGINLSETLFVGDSYNDLELLKITGFCGCPANADEEIKDLVRSRKGIVSKFEVTEGFIDIISRYFKGIL